MASRRVAAYAGGTVSLPMLMARKVLPQMSVVTTTAADLAKRGAGSGTGLIR